MRDLLGDRIRMEALDAGSSLDEAEQRALEAGARPAAERFRDYAKLVEDEKLVEVIEAFEASPSGDPGLTQALRFELHVRGLVSDAVDGRASPTVAVPPPETVEPADAAQITAILHLAPKGDLDFAQLDIGGQSNAVLMALNGFLSGSESAHSQVAELLERVRAEMQRRGA